MTHQSTHFHILQIFLTEISPELMQIFATGKLHFYSFVEYYVLHLKIQGVKIWSLYHFKTTQVIEIPNWFRRQIRIEKGASIFPESLSLELTKITSRWRLLYIAYDFHSQGSWLQTLVIVIEWWKRKVNHRDISPLCSLLSVNTALSDERNFMKVDSTTTCVSCGLPLDL